jgi:DNA-binding transcriptional MerR regulator
VPRDEVVGLPSHKVWALAGMPASTLNYWVQIGLVEPSLRRPEGRRVEYWWSVEDVVVVRTLRALRLAGAPLQRLRPARRQLLEWGEQLTAGTVVWNGYDVLLVGSAGHVASLVERPGQGVLQFAVVPVAQWHQEALREAEAVDLARFRRERRQRRRRDREQADRARAAAAQLLAGGGDYGA